MKRDFDVLISGSSIGCLFAAVLLAKRGFSINVLTTDEDLKPITHDGFSLYPGGMVCETISRTFFDIIFEELDLPKVEIARFQRLYTTYQISFPNNSITISPNQEIFLEELNHAFPEDYLQINCFFKELEKRSLEWKRSYKVGDALSVNDHVPYILTPVKEFMHIFSLKNDLILQMLTAMIKSNTLLQQEEYLGMHLYCSNSLDRRRQYGLPGGKKELKSFLLNNLSSFFNVPVRTDSTIENINFRSGVLDSVQLSSFEGIVKTNMLITDQTPWSLKTIGSKIPILAQRKSLSPASRAFSLFIMIEEEGLPLGIKDQILIIKDPASPLTGANFCMLFIKDKSHGPTGKRVLELRFFLDEKQSLASKDLAIKTAIKALDATKQLIPHINDYTISRYPDPLADPPMAPITGELTYTTNLRRWFGNNWKNYLGYQTFQPIQNILHVGPTVLPSLGFEGEVVSGLLAANQATKMLKK